MTRSRFHGEIYGVGTTSGVRIVVGHWTRSPLGEFTDVMVQFADGQRLLIAPNEDVREFVTATYIFDSTELVPVTFVAEPNGWRSVQAGDLSIRIRVAGPTVLGRALSIVPDAVSTAPWFCAISDPIARVVLRGVRTRGSAGGGRREYYGARHQHRVTDVSASWQGEDLGSLTPVTPPVTFGFGSTPAAPSVTSITTTIDS
ncbi:MULTISPECIES: hypothetical protein [unclassified Rhodococcus (in: high G+C Gram-positive bacteria)]|uniref:hypothetical protein n=1 Tax=unclassified Rhodococcus (in: high G+C Gram-positive bacteria) TaxID=192944 RepID=UPI0007BBE44F|nr:MULTISPECIES: hypothetical protein [unclassified Rhodococcus (in: high G+C Gram-positive bacteria)]KZF08210.1 hypothetical protein A2J02_21070 [Rhodococcus sp. EPR-147]KZF09970.1 hypothetical protein A2J04_21625 [Rhodococcus sp. EPR-279]